MFSFRTWGVSLCARVCAAVLFFGSSVTLAQQLELSGIGVYHEYNQPNLVVRFDSVPETGATSASSQTSIRNRISVRFLSNKTQRRWGQFWSQNVSLNHSEQVLAENFDDLFLMMDGFQGDLFAGDLVSFEQRFDGDTLVRLNSVELVQIEGEGFFEFLRTALVGRVPPSNGLKDQLLGLDKDTYAEDMLLFSSVEYSSDREEVVWSWVEEPEPEIVPPVSVESASATVAEVATTEAASAVEPERVQAVADVENTPQAEAQDIQAVQAEAQVDAQVDQAQEAEEAARIAEEEAQAEAAALEAQRAEAREAARRSLLATQFYQQQIRNLVYSNIEYPTNAIRRNRTGVVRLALSVNRRGQIVDIEVVSSSSHDDLDEAAIDGAAGAGPFPPLPDEILDDSMLFEFPITFALE